MYRLFFHLAVTLAFIFTLTPPSHAINADVQEELDYIYELIYKLAKQTMVQQEMVEERVRTDGQSGIKQLRHDTEGTKNYFGTTHIDYSMAGIHDHSDYNRILGMGEINAVINGVEFRTRHMDYKLYRPSTTNKTYGAVEPIPFPDVPPAVLNKATVQEQIEEMKLWFKAFVDQDYSVRDYTKYFKPLMCYMEGMWITDDDSTITEPFQSDRHFLNADSWEELMEMVRYTSYTGTKDNKENLAFHPRKIMDVDPESCDPRIATWTYRILCHPIDIYDIPLSYFKQRDDWSYNYPRGRSRERVRASRGARFQLNEYNNDRFTDFSLLDEIMQEIPGLDNVPAADLKEGYGGNLYSAEEPGVPLKAGYYHRWYKFARRGAMGTAYTKRGFADEPLFVAVNTRNKVAPMSINECSQGTCTKHTTRVSYAIPMEIVYLTPLLKWNPYNIAFNTNPDITRANGRDGETAATAFKGIDFETYYKTPVSLFSGGAVEADVADTVRAVVMVEDKQGKVRNVTASGTRVILPSIDGVGQVRLRYPIHPIHMEGSPVWKEVNVIKDFLNADPGKGVSRVTEFKMSALASHNHAFYLNYDDLETVNSGGVVKVTTNQANGHTHTLEISYDENNDRYVYLTCDGAAKCFDGHGIVVRPQ